VRSAHVGVAVVDVHDQAVQCLIGDQAASGLDLGKFRHPFVLLSPVNRSWSARGTNLAAAYRAVGRVDEAILLFEQTLAARERVLGPTIPTP